MAPERALLVGLSVIVCRFAQPLGKFLWVRVRHKAPVEIPLGGCEGSAESRVTCHADHAHLRSHDNDCPRLSKSKFLLC